MSSYVVAADDLDLNPPIKSRLLRVTTSAVYHVWVEDWDDIGEVALAERRNRDACDLGDLIRYESPIDGGIVAEPLDAYDLIDRDEDECGPWQTCPVPGCVTVQYPAYIIDATCPRHRVIGCQLRGLPERTFAGADGDAR